MPSAPAAAAPTAAEPVAPTTAIAPDQARVSPDQARVSPGAGPAGTIHRRQLRHGEGHRPSALKLWAAMLTLYVVWGSTYLGIAVSIQTIPPFFMGAIRFAIAGTVLLVFELVRHRGELTWPSRRQWRDSAIVGVLLLGFGNGFVALGERTVPSGIAAILIAMMPLWLAVFGWLYFRERLPRIVVLGVVIGLVGVALLVWPVGAGANAFDAFGIIVLMLSPIAWSHGSLFSARAAHLPPRPLVATSLQMLLAAVVLGVIGVLVGELESFHPAKVSTASLLALTYLIVVGSMVAFNAYAWLLRNAPLSLIGTYAYVNPVVAVGLGAIFLAEPISLRTVVAAAVILAAVAMIVTARGRMSRTAPVKAPEPPIPASASASAPSAPAGT
jgi:drug/metabolite transporter (DMT)-like permease